MEANKTTLNLTKFHVSSVKVYIRKLIGRDVRPISDGTVIFFCPAPGREGERLANEIVEKISTTFRISLNRGERIGSFGQRQEWEATGDNYQIFVCLRRN